MSIAQLRALSPHYLAVIIALAVVAALAVFAAPRPATAQSATRTRHLAGQSRPMGPPTTLTMRWQTQINLIEWNTNFGVFGNGGTTQNMVGPGTDDLTSMVTISSTVPGVASLHGPAGHHRQ